MTDRSNASVNKKYSKTSYDLFQIKAGRMYLKEKKVVPDKRLGYFSVHITDDNLTHFCWRTRDSEDFEDDWIVFKDNIDFEQVDRCTTGNVFLLRFRTSKECHFIWIQETKTLILDHFTAFMNMVVSKLGEDGASTFITSQEYLDVVLNAKMEKNKLPSLDCLYTGDIIPIAGDKHLHNVFTTTFLNEEIKHLKLDETIFSPLLPDSRLDEQKNFPIDVKNELKETFKSPHFLKTVAILSNFIKNGNSSNLFQQFEFNSACLSTSLTGNFEQITKSIKTDKVVKCQISFPKNSESSSSEE
ncbi:hypothetical protein A3Q56_04054 [Intoshia linei]|uniref:Pru domain-containing protein n=1 Tax=Intoshia linei TaxID=1819745 RepID=A0A177B1Q3_9BILA|nr:hypothetical protein A3Q56_04054 [Intoshia linei]